MTLSQMSQVHDPSFDVALILKEASLASRYCAEKASETQKEGWKLCKLLSEVADTASNALIMFGIEGQAPFYNSEENKKSKECKGITHVDMYPFLTLCLDILKKVRSTCGAHSDESCKQCTQSAEKAISICETILASEEDQLPSSKEQAS